MKDNILTTILSISFLFSYSQKDYKGKVLDAVDGSAISGANIILKGSNFKIGTITDYVGYFLLSIPDSVLKQSLQDTLLVSFIGYQSAVIFVSSDTHDSLSILLNPDKGNIGEVVVVGYGTQTSQGVVSFPWPPPDCTAKCILNKAYFKTVSKLQDANAILLLALNYAGYSEQSYYYVPNGFALVTKIEQIDKNGVPLSAPERWSIETANSNLSWKKYISSLFFSTAGYFRIIVFIITNSPFLTSEEYVSKKTATKWLRKGLNTLPKEIAKLKYNEDYDCTALIYEFKKPESDEAFLITNSIISANEHLEKTKILEKLKAK